MSAASEKLRLGENHRRAISVLLRGIEQMGEDIRWWMERNPGLFFEIGNDLPAENAEKLRWLLDSLHGELERIAGQIELDVQERSRKRAIRALITAYIVHLEESTSSRLQGFGYLPREDCERLDAEIARLTEILEEMLRVVETG
jgi:hypothetical protein